MNYLLLRHFRALLFPTRCPVCGELIRVNEKFCEKCAEMLTPYTGGDCVHGAKSLTAAFVYDENSSPAIIQMKRGVSGNSPYALAYYITERLKQRNIADSLNCIIAVPMHRADAAERGFNQSDRIAWYIGKMLGIPVEKHAVVKIRVTAQQKLLSRREREKNLRNAFAVKNAEAIRGKRVLLVDDVATTGSTLAELTALLTRNGAAEVHCAAGCKTQTKN